MKKLKTAVLITSCCAVGFSCFSQSVAEPEVFSAAQRWADQSRHLAKQVTPFFKQRGRVRQVEKRQLDGASLPFYVVQLEPEGFMIMNSDKRLPPVLAFSSSGSVDLSDSSGNALVSMLRISMQRSQQRLLKLPSTGLSLTDSLFSAEAEEKNASAWDSLLESGSAAASAGVELFSVSNGPFLSTTWNQNNHYNELCPVDPGSAPGSYYDGRVPVGCVAVVGAQLMNYYQWPYRGTGSHSYTDSEGSITGFHSADFSDTFDWPNMQDSYYPWGSEPVAAVNAVSELMYEVGVSVEMNYESAGSSSSTYDLAVVLKDNFFYERGAYASTNSQGIGGLLVADLLASRPAIVSIPGHAVVADGYTEENGTEYFHINYGWGGDNNSWYLIDDIKGNPAVTCVTGVYPALTPMNKTPDGTTNNTSDVEIEWALPAVREAEVESLSVLQHRLNSTVFSDPADDFSCFKITSTSDFKDWTITNSGYSGSCFYKMPNGYSNREYHLTSIEKFIPSSGTNLSFRLKARLASDVFRVRISTDNGDSWTDKYSLTDYYNHSFSWQLVAINLSEFAGSEVLIRFEYVVDSCYPDGGVWLDEIQFTGGSWYDWVSIQTTTNLVSGSTVLSGLTNGTYTLALQAFDGAEWGPRSSPFTIIVDAPEFDTDSDGLPNEWEQQYFGGETNAVAGADSDGDGFSNLQEYISGFDPTDNNSFFSLNLSETPVAGEGFVVGWTSVTGRVYAVNWTTNLRSGFLMLETNIVWPQASYTDTLHNAESGGFYKINVQMAP